MIDHIFAAIRPQLIILTIVYLLVLFVIFLDLWAGIRKARKRGELRSSLGYRKTVEKIAKYFNLIFVVTAIDAVQMLTVWQINEQTGSRVCGKQGRAGPPPAADSDSDGIGGHVHRLHRAEKRI